MRTLQVGILVPWINTAMEEEIPTISHPDVGLHWSRLRPAVLPKDGHDTAYLEHMLSSIPNALSLFGALDLHAIILGCTSAKLSIPCPNIELPKPYAHLPFITAFDAIILQLKKLKAAKLFLFAPYDADVIAAETHLLQSYGFDVVKSVSLTYDSEIRNISMEQLYCTFMEEYTYDCDVIVFSCTALYTLGVINRIRTNLRVDASVISSNTAIADTLGDLYHQRRQEQLGGNNAK